MCCPSAYNVLLFEHLEQDIGSYNFIFVFIVCVAGQTASGPCTANITDLLCFPFYLPIYQSRIPNELHDFNYGGVIIVIWRHKKWPRWRNRKWAIASQSQRTCVADSSSSRRLSQVGSSVSPNLKRCPFRWKCRVSSPTIHLNWSLLSFNRSLGLLTEGSNISPFACLSLILSLIIF
jgi:hypothetical protein